jgi:hypothetical protein
MTREQIIAAEDRPVETVDVPEWGGPVRLRGMSGQDRWTWGNTRDTATDLMAAMLVRCIVDDTGNRIFTDDDAPALALKSAGVLERLRRVADRLSGLGEDAAEQSKNA